jgi:hypothetical protein
MLSMRARADLESFQTVLEERPTVAVVFSHPSRVELRAATLALLRERATVEAPPPLVWTGQGVDVADFRELLASPALASGDLLFLEDDVAPCLNGYPYMLAWSSPHLTSFYNPGRPYGLGAGFIFSQAFKVPAALVARMRAESFPPPHPKLQRDGIDNVVHRYLTRWGLPFFQHRSVVQHVGEVSTWSPPARLDEPGRQAVDWPGPDVDAFTVFR